MKQPELKKIMLDTVEINVPWKMFKKIDPKIENYNYFGSYVQDVYFKCKKLS